MSPLDLSRRLRDARVARGLSQQAVAEIVGVPRTAITQIEAGNRSVSTLELAKMASCYRCPVEFFLSSTSPSSPRTREISAPGLFCGPIIAKNRPGFV